MTFKEICIQDGKLTEAGELACSMVYEHITRKCWHIVIGERGGVGGHVVCSCGDVRNDIAHFSQNPPLATSLNAWTEHIWSVMDAVQRANHSMMLNKIKTGSLYVWDSKPIHHLEAALRACELYEQWDKTCNG